MNKVFQFLESPKKGLALMLFLNIAMHIWFINLPPCSVHVWRQCNTLAVARNFSKESMNIFKPRVDRRSYTDGVTGMQFPAYEYMVAMCYKIFGEHYFISRLVSLVLYSLSVVCFYFFIFRISKSNLAAFVGAWSFCWSPELFYFGICALPDVLALCSGIISLYYFMKWRDTKKNKFLPFSFLLLTLAGLVKIQFMMFGGFVLGVVLLDLFNKKISFKLLPLIMIYGIISIAICLSWYVYATWLIEKSGLRDFGLTFKPADNFVLAKQIIIKNLVSDFPELLMNFAGTVLFVIGIVIFFFKKKWKNNFFIPFLVWAVLFLIYYLIELKQMEMHQYYLLPVVPLLCLVMSYAGLQLSKSKFAFVLLVIMFAQPVLACIRIIPARWLNKDRAIPTELFDERTNLLLRNAIPDKALCITGPDESGCKYLFFLHKKGMDFSYPEQLDSVLAISGITYIEDCIENGATYLITPETMVLENETLKKYFKREVISVQNFKVIELKSLKELRD